MKTRLLFLSFLLLLGRVQAQVVDDFNKLSVTLKDGTTVTLYGKAWDIGDRTPEQAQQQGVLKDKSIAKDGHYYYLPANLRLSRNKNGIPQFLLLKYVTDEKTPDRDMSGALMHFLLEWGLNEAQKKECEELLRKAKPLEPDAKIMGPVMLFTPDGDSFTITSAVASDKGLSNSTVLTSGRAPQSEGGKIAIAANMNKYGAQLMAATLDKPKGKTSVGDLSVSLNFKYQTRLPAIKGRVIFDWEKLAKNVLADTTQQTVQKNLGGLVGAVFIAFTGNTATWDENKLVNKQTLYEELSQKGIITVELQETFTDDRTKAIRESIFDMFTQTISKVFESYQDKSSEDPNSRLDNEAQLNRQSATEYQQKFKEKRVDSDFKTYLQSIREVQRKGRQVIELNYALAVEHPFTMTENILSWYEDAKKYNDACVSRVILNDPFFQRLRIQFVLDKDMVDIFDQEVNYATVNIRKKRNEGGDFTSRVTLDKTFVKENGVQAAVTYAGGGDKNPDMYEYQVQYSFRGGNVFPSSPNWQRGTMEAVTLYPPIKMHNVEFESDLDQMKEYKIARATMQIRYRRLGEEYQASIPVSPTKGQALASKAIFMDKDLKGFAYRIIYDHKEEGKLATEWEAKLGAIDYLYAPVPEAFRDKESEAFKKAKQLGQIITPSSSTEGKVVDKVLDAFKVLFDK